jgi:Zn-finger nucleic acid-binding protein
MRRATDLLPWSDAVAYRDRPPACPRCGVELLRRQRRDIWRCPRCAGTQLASSELERRLRVLAPDISEEVIRDVMIARKPRAAAVRRRMTAAVACATCGRPMQPVAMGGVHVARCDADDQIWLDAAELERIAARVGARHQSQRSWLARLFSHLFAS